MRLLPLLRDFLLSLIAGLAANYLFTVLLNISTADLRTSSGMVNFSF